MKPLLITSCAVALIACAANAQTSSTTTTTTAQSPASNTTGSTTTTSDTESTGTVTEFTPGSTIVLNSGSGEPAHYKLGKNVTYINAKGKQIKAERIRKDRKVRVHYTKEGNDMVVHKVTIVRDKE